MPFFVFFVTIYLLCSLWFLTFVITVMAKDVYNLNWNLKFHNEDVFGKIINKTGIVMVICLSSFSLSRITVSIAVKYITIQISVMVYYFNLPITQTNSVFSPLNQMLYFYPQFLILLNFFVALGVSKKSGFHNNAINFCPW